MNHSELRADLKALADAALKYLMGPRLTAGAAHNALMASIKRDNVQIVLGVKKEEPIEVRTQVPPELLEKLAELEHRQWVHWTRYMLDNLTPENIHRWKRQTETAYRYLTEAEKEADRIWVRKMIEEILSYDA